MTKKYRVDRSFFPWVGAHFLEFWYFYIGAFSCLYLLHSFQSQIPQMAKDLGEKLIAGDTSEVSASAFLLLALSIVVFRTASRLLFFYPARVQQKSLRMEMLDKMNRTHPERYMNYNDGQIFQILNEDINRLRGFIGFGLLQVGNIIIAFFVFIPKIKEFNPGLLVAFTPLLVGVVVFSFILIIFQSYLKKAMQAAGEVQNFIIESYEGKQTIKNFHGESTILSKFRNLVSIEMKHFFVGSLGPTISLPMIRLSFGASLLWGAYIIKAQGLGATSLIFFSGFLFLITEPIGFLSWIGVVITSAFAGWRRLKEFNNLLDAKVKEVPKEISFWNSQLNLEIKENSWVVFCGDTGIGKSYLLKELADRYAFDKKSFSLVSQEPYLYNDTLINNIILGQEKTSELEQRVWDLIQTFELEHLNNTKEEVLNLELGENGKKVSGGQAKRVALMRSLLSGADTFLWDDPFSSVDFILEQKIVKKLRDRKYFENKTLVMTSHRLSSVRYCEEVYLLDKDGIAERGDVVQLLNSESRVRAYFAKQMV